MDYNNLGGSGLKVSRLGLGTYNFGVDGENPAERERLLRRAVDAGINLIDTANVYHDGASEIAVGRAIRGIRDDIVLATKVYNPIGPGPNDRGLSAYHIKREVERSLRRLGCDHIDIYLLHRLDPRAAFTETVAALGDLVRAGKIRYWGTSIFPISEVLAVEPGGVGIVRSWQLAELVNIADRLLLPRPICEHVPYNLVEREVEQHMLPVCAEYRIGSIAYSPLAMGLLTERFLNGDTPRFVSWFRGDDPVWDVTRAAVARASELAAERGMSLPELAHRWLLTRRLSCVLAGPRTIEHLEMALSAAVAPPLDQEICFAVDQICAPGQSLWMRPAEQLHRASAHARPGALDD